MFLTGKLENLGSEHGSVVCGGGEFSVLAVIIVTLCLLSACARHVEPQTVYDHARQTYRHGNINAARTEAEDGYKKFHSTSQEWAWSFIILRANALHAQGRDAEA